MKRAVPFEHHYVINIKCDEDHLIAYDNHQGKAPLRNCILETIQQEMGFDHYYLAATRTILVRLDK